MNGDATVGVVQGEGGGRHQLTTIEGELICRGGSGVAAQSTLSGDREDALIQDGLAGVAVRTAEHDHGAQTFLGKATRAGDDVGSGDGEGLGVSHFKNAAACSQSNAHIVARGIQSDVVSHHQPPTI